MKKTWIKVKRGILEPKHINKLGAAWYLYLYILDQTEWNSGTITDWKDEYASQDLSKPIALIRAHRRLLEDEKYITCEKNQHSQTIIVHNWTDPRRYDGVVQNESVENDEPEFESTPQSVPQSTGQSVPQTILIHEQIPLSSYSHISHINISHNTEEEEGESEEISTPPPSPVYSYSNARIWAEVTGMVAIPGSEISKVLPALDALRVKFPNQDELIAYLKRYYADWQKRKRKDGATYSRTNCAWLYDLAVAEETLPEDKRIAAAANRPDPNCKVCGGIGMVAQNLKPSDPGFGKLKPCECTKGEKK
jgi:hypothetical protein